jgi:hypothetical protein
LPVTDKLRYFAQGIAYQFGHVTGDIVLVHEFGFGGELEQYGKLLKRGRNIDVRDRIGGGSHTFRRDEVGCRNDRDTGGACPKWLNLSENYGVGFPKGLGFLKSEFAQYDNAFSMGKHFHFCAD